MSDANPYRLDPLRLRQNLERAAVRFDRAAVLVQETGERMLERLLLIKLQPQRILDLGCVTGLVTVGLFARYRTAIIIGLERSEAMLRLARRRAPWLRRLRALCASADAVPCADASIDLIFSNLALQAYDDLDRVFAECWRVLKPGGLLLFSLAGPDTLRELRTAGQRCDDAVHVHAFIDMHDIGDALLRARFADPVMDVEHFTLTYRKLDRLIDDLRALGATNAAIGRPRGLLGRGRRNALQQAYETFRTDEGVLPATVEIAYGHAWKPEQPRSFQREPGVATFPVSQLRRRA